MLFYKSWLETRWRFVGGLALLALSASGAVLVYPEVVRLMQAAPSINVGGELGRRITDAVELARTYRGYIWSQWFRQNMPQLWTLIAIALGSGGLLAQATGGGALFTLALPISRQQVVLTRAATVIAELAVLALVPAVIFPVLSPLVGESYGFADALVHSVCMLFTGILFFSLAFLLSTVFSDVWRPLLLAVCIAFVIGLLEQLPGEALRVGVFRIMSGGSYFLGDGVPWLGLLVTSVLSAAMLAAASRNLARQDF